MPLYEYRCSECGEKFEIIQKISDASLKKCPSCGGALKKLFSPPMLQFKGSGWYITDYAKKDSGKEGKEDGRVDNKENK
ncbi:MAG: FmdB family zinc ribbon protein [Candidatus Aminicenantia bacterium]